MGLGGRSRRGIGGAGVELPTPRRGAATRGGGGGRLRLRRRLGPGMRDGRATVGGLTLHDRKRFFWKNVGWCAVGEAVGW